MVKAYIQQNSRFSGIGLLKEPTFANIMMRSGNPALSDDTFSSSSYQDKPWWDGFDLADESTTMSIEGTAEKTGILLGITILTALFTAFSMPASAPLMTLGFLGGFITAMVVIFSRSTNPVLICLYAVFEGMALGGLTWFYELAFPGIGIVSAFLTFGILGVMLTIYRMGLIHWDENTRIAITSAVIGIFVIYIVSIIASFFGYTLPIMAPGPWVLHSVYSLLESPLSASQRILISLKEVYFQVLQKNSNGEPHLA